MLNAVADRPDRPQDAVLSACEQTFAVVSWSPAADNNAPITGYIVYYVTSHDDSDVSGDNGPHVGARVGASDVSARVRLAPWTQYWFSVAAVNDVGVGLRTDVSAASPCETDPGPPNRSPNRVCTNSQRPDQLVIIWEVCASLPVSCWLQYKLYKYCSKLAMSFESISPSASAGAPGTFSAAVVVHLGSSYLLIQHPFNDPLSGTILVSKYQIWILLKQETVSGNGIS